VFTFSRIKNKKLLVSMVPAYIYIYISCSLFDIRPHLWEEEP
jgi:hypothetical protein